METVFVTGGSGFLGKALIYKLIERGDKVKVLLRPTSQFNIDHPLIEKVIGDVRDRKSFEKSLIGVDKIYHLAGVVTDWAPRKLYEEVHINGTKNILDAVIQAGVKKIIHISTIDVLDHDNYSFIDENTRYTSSYSPYRYTKVEAEKLVLESCKKNIINAVVIRPSWIYGPGDTTFFPEIAYQVKKESMVFIGNPNNLLPLVYIDNLVIAIIKAGEIDVANGESFLISDGEITWKELVNRITFSINSKVTKLCLPYSVAYYIALIMELISSIINKKQRPLLTRGAVEMMGKTIKVNNKKSKKILGYESFISLDKGIENSIQWLKSRPIKELRKK